MISKKLSWEEVHKATSMYCVQWQLWQGAVMDQIRK